MPQRSATGPIGPGPAAYAPADFPVGVVPSAALVRSPHAVRPASMRIEPSTYIGRPVGDLREVGAPIVVRGFTPDGAWQPSTSRWSRRSRSAIGS